VEAIVWFGFRVLGCRSTAKGAPWASFRSLGGLGEIVNLKKNPKQHGGLLGVPGYKNSANPFVSAVFFCPSLLPSPPGRFIFGWGPYRPHPLVLTDRYQLRAEGHTRGQEYALCTGARRQQLLTDA
jgi:hypothetical protein